MKSILTIILTITILCTNQEKTFAADKAAVQGAVQTIKGFAQILKTAHREAKAVLTGQAPFTEDRQARILARLIDAHCEAINTTLDWEMRNNNRELWRELQQANMSFELTELNPLIQETLEVAMAPTSSARIQQLQEGLAQAVALFRKTTRL